MPRAAPGNHSFGLCLTLGLASSSSPNHPFLLFWSFASFLEDKVTFPHPAVHLDCPSDGSLAPPSLGHRSLAHRPLWFTCPRRRLPRWVLPLGHHLAARAVAAAVARATSTRLHPFPAPASFRRPTWQVESHTLPREMSEPPRTGPAQTAWSPGSLTRHRPQPLLWAAPPGRHLRTEAENQRWPQRHGAQLLTPPARLPRPPPPAARLSV